MNQLGPPEYTERAGIHTFVWPEQFKVRVDRIQQSQSRGDIQAEVAVESLRPGEVGHITRARVNLLTTVGKNAVVRACKEKVPDIEWLHLVDTAFEQVIRKAREGEPAVLLADVEASEAIDWRLYPILPEGLVAMLFGLGGSLKTYLAGYWAYLVALGLNGAEPGNVLILDWESNKDDWSRRMKMIAESMGHGEAPNIAHRFCALPLAQDIEEIQRMGADLGTDLYIIDSAMYACGGEPEKADPVLTLFRGVRALHKSTLIIGHVNNTEDTKRPYGNVAWWNSSRNLFQVQARQEAGSPAVDVGLYNRKTNVGQIMPPIGYGIEFHQQASLRYTPGDWVKFSSASVKDVPELAEHLPDADRVKNALANEGRSTAPHIAEATGIRENHVRAVLSRMGGRNQVKKFGDEWALLQPVEQAQQA